VQRQTPSSSAFVPQKPRREEREPSSKTPSSCFSSAVTFSLRRRALQPCHLGWLLWSRIPTQVRLSLTFSTLHTIGHSIFKKLTSVGQRTFRLRLGIKFCVYEEIWAEAEQKFRSQFWLKILHSLVDWAESPKSSDNANFGLTPAVDKVLFK